MYFCNYCGNQIPKWEILGQIRHASAGQCSRLMFSFKCNNCNKRFNYRDIAEHKQKFKKVLELLQNPK